MTRRLAAVLAAVGVALVALAGPASAEPRGRIVGIEPTGDGTVRVAFSVAGLADGQGIDPASMRMTLDGRPVEAAVADGGGAVPGVQRRVMMTIDTSGSMRGSRIEGARAAATAFLDAVPADVEVGLVTFSTAAQVVVPLTRDRGPIRAAVAGLQATGDTALYDAVALALGSFPETGDRSILLLSDGADDGSTRSLADVVGVLDKGGAALNAVAFQNPDVTSTLDQLTSAAGGRVVQAAAAAELSAAFTQAAEGLDQQVVVVADVPQGVDGEATVQVSGTAAGAPVSDSALAIGLRPAGVEDALAGFGPRPAEPAPSWLDSPAVVGGALAAIFLGLLVLVRTALTSLRVSGRNTVSGRLAIYSLSGRGTVPEAVTENASFADQVVGLADRAVKARGLEERLGAKLQAGGVPLKPSEWVLLHAGIVLFVPLLALLLTAGNVTLVLVSFVLAVLGPLGYLSLKQRRRHSAFLAQLPETLQLMSGSLSAGYSLPQAVDAVVQQGNEPVATEFNKALVEARLGAPIEDALDDVAERTGSQDFSWVVMAIRIQRDVGGNLAEVLSTVAATLRERERLRRQVLVLSAEGRLSAWILGGLPVVFALYLLATRPQYLSPLVEDQLGWVMIGMMVLLMTVGGFWLRKVVKVDI